MRGVMQAQNPTCVMASVILLCAGMAGAAPALSYNRDIRPILSENCFYCHGQDGNKRKADLQLNTLEGQRADGIIVPGKPEESLLLDHILSTDPDEVMPPPEPLD